MFGIDASEKQMSALRLVLVIEPEAEGIGLDLFLFDECLKKGVVF
jgi:hypothetical protein